MIILWLLNLIPNFSIHLLVVVSVLALVITQFFSFIPFVNIYLTPIKIVAIVVLVFSVYLEGAISSNDIWQEKVKEKQLEIQKSETVSAELNAKLTGTILKNQELIKEINNINRNRLNQLSPQLNKQCTVNSDVIGVLNSAASNRKENKK